MRKARASVIALISALSLLGLSGGLLSSVLALLSNLWWLGPLSVSVASMPVLVVAAGLGRRRRRTALTQVMTASYLSSGVSFGVASLIPRLSLGTSLPTWADALLVSSLLVSSYVYYLAAGPSREEMLGAGESIPPFST